MNVPSDLIMSFVVRDNELINVRTYQSAAFMTAQIARFFNLIDRMMGSGETKLFSWTAFLYISSTYYDSPYTSDDTLYYRKAAFVLTNKCLYISTGDITREFVYSCGYFENNSYCLFNDESYIMPSLTLNLCDTIEIMYEKDDETEQKLLNILHTLKIYMA